MKTKHAPSWAKKSTQARRPRTPLRLWCDEQAKADGKPATVGAGWYAVLRGGRRGHATYAALAERVPAELRGQLRDRFGAMQAAGLSEKGVRHV